MKTKQVFFLLSGTPARHTPFMLRRPDLRGVDKVLKYMSRALAMHTTGLGFVGDLERARTVVQEAAKRIKALERQLAKARKRECK